MAVLINHVIRSKDHTHTHVARQFFEAKQCGAIRQTGNWQTVFSQMHSQIVIPQFGNIAANRGSADACAVQLGREPPALCETFVKNRSVEREVRPRWRQVPARIRHFDEHSSHRHRTDFQHASAVDHFTSCENL
jgi:hypothetical protein